MVANPERGEVEIRLDGQTFIMRPTFQALMEIEQLTGQKIVPLVRNLTRAQYGILDLAAIVTAGIHGGGDKGAKLEVVGEMIARAGVTNVKLMTSITEFCNMAIEGGVKSTGEA